MVASCDLPVMLCGETGTGKDVFAQAIHNASVRRDGPFIAQNCAAIPDTLLESILFGTAKGAFTGAVETKGTAGAGRPWHALSGRAEFHADLFTVKLLPGASGRDLPKHWFHRGEAVRPEDHRGAEPGSDPRIACGHLRQDIYYRLSIMSISIPPLRERKEDIQSFVETFIKRHNKTFQKQIRYVSTS